MIGKFPPGVAPLLGAIALAFTAAGCNTSHIAAQEVPAIRADTITAGQPVEDQGMKYVREETIEHHYDP